MITFIEKTNSAGQPISTGDKFSISFTDSEIAALQETKSIYIRKGYKNGNFFLSQRGNGGGGAGDICAVGSEGAIEVSSNLFDRLRIWADKNNVIVKGVGL